MARHRIRPFLPADFDAVQRLWAASEGLGTGPGDSAEAIGRFLDRNPGLSLVVEDGSSIVGAILCGHDGRRGHLYHLAVARGHRREGFAAALVRQCLQALSAEGIGRCLVRVQADNAGARAFWKAAGARLRDDLVEFTIDIEAEPHA